MQILHPIGKNPKGLNQRCVVFSGKANDDANFSKNLRFQL